MQSTTQQRGLFTFDTLAAVTEFDGGTYEPAFDRERLKGQLKRVFDVMADGEWFTLSQIAKAAAPCSESAAGARIRDFRKARNGGHKVETKRSTDGGSVWLYRLIVNEQ